LRGGQTVHAGQPADRRGGGSVFQNEQSRAAVGEKLLHRVELSLVQSVIGNQEANAGDVRLGQGRSGRAGVDLDGLSACLLKSPSQVVEELRRVFVRIVAQEQNVDLFGFRLNKVNRVVEIVVVAGQHQAFARRSLRQLRRGNNPALARRHVNLERGRASH